MPTPIIAPVSGTPAQLVTPTRPFELVNPLAWPTANNLASLAARTRADQIAEPTYTAATGEMPFAPESSAALFKIVLRGAASAIARGEVLTANLWEWRQIPGIPGTSVGSWSPNLVGRWTFTFNSTGDAAKNTLGVAGSAVLATDIYCSNIAVVATYDRRGDMTTRWSILQPAADDGSPAMLLVDGLGSSRFTWEGRTTTNGTAFNFLAAWLSIV